MPPPCSCGIVLLSFALSVAKRTILRNANIASASNENTSATHAGVILQAIDSADNATSVELHLDFDNLFDQARWWKGAQSKVKLAT